MKKLLTILFFFIIAFAQSQDYRTIDWKFIVSDVVLINTDTFQINAVPTDFNDKGAISRTVGNYVTDFVDRTFKVIDSTSTTLTVVDLAHENIAPQTNQIARCYRSVLNASSLFSSIGGVDVSVLDELSRWRGVARNNELFARAIDTLDQIKLENPVETIIFNTSYSVTGDEVIGEIFWDEDNETYSAVLKDGVVGQLFEEVFITAQNNTGGTLADGKVATYEGTIGNSGNMRIELTVASADEPSFLTIGIITQDIEDNETGKVTTLGKVRGIQTDGANYGETWEDKDILYKSSTYAGGLTNVEPNAPIPAIPLAIVISAHATNGTLLVRPTFPVALTQLPDVNGTPVIASGQFPVWNNEEGYFDFDFNINDYSIILADSVTIATGAGSPTVNQLQLLIDNIGSSGFFLGGELSDGGAGTLDVAAGSGFIRTTNDENAELQSFKWSASAGIAVTDNTTQYVYVDDSGVISLSTDEFLETPDKIQIGVVTKESGDVAHTFSLGVRLQESIGNAGRFIRRVHGISRDKRRGGLIFGQSGDANRDVSITQGSLWWGRTEYLIPTFNTSGANTFITYSAGGLEDAAATAWPNLQYDNSGTLTNLGNNKWANLFFFIEPDSHIDMVYGRSQFNSEALADLEGVPSTSLPSIISQTSILAARFTFQKGSNTATISSAFEQLFANAGVTRHGDMSGLDYESAGHTGFVSDSNLIDSLNTIRDTTDALRIDINQNTTDISTLQSSSHPAVTLGTENGLSLSTQELSLAAATNSTPGAATAAQITKLEGIEAGAEVNVNADWNSSSGDSEILNKPSSFTPSSHNSTHENGGGDKINVAGLSGVLADNQPTSSTLDEVTVNGNSLSSGFLNYYNGTNIASSIISTDGSLIKISTGTDTPLTIESTDNASVIIIKDDDYEWAVGELSQTFIIRDVTAGNLDRIKINSSGNIDFQDGILTTTGSINIGSENNVYTLHVYDNSGTSTDFAAKIRNSGGVSAAGGVWIDTRWNTDDNFILRLTTNQEANDIFAVKGSGRVGINKPEPTEALDVVGNGKISGSLTVTGEGIFQSGATVADAPVTNTDVVRKLDVEDASIDGDFNSLAINGVPVVGGWNYAVQALSGTPDTLAVGAGLNATITIAANSIIHLEDLEPGMTGNITVTNPATQYTLTLTGYTIQISPFLTFSGDAITMSGGSAKDVLSWYYDGTQVIINGTYDYQ